MTILRGQVIAEDGIVLAEPGIGQPVTPPRAGALTGGSDEEVPCSWTSRRAVTLPGRRATPSGPSAPAGAGRGLPAQRPRVRAGRPAGSLRDAPRRAARPVPGPGRPDASTWSRTWPGRRSWRASRATTRAGQARVRGEVRATVRPADDGRDPGGRLATSRCSAAWPPSGAVPDAPARRPDLRAVREEHRDLGTAWLRRPGVGSSGADRQDHVELTVNGRPVGRRDRARGSRSPTPSAPASG